MLKVENLARLLTVLKSFWLVIFVLAMGRVAVYGQDVGKLTLPISGELTFGDECTSAMQDKLRESMDHLIGQLFAEGVFSSCVADAVLSQTHGATAEQIVSRLQEPIPTHIECKDKVCGRPEASGCASVGIEDEVISLQKANITNATIESVAGTILHEVAHNKGWNHPPSGEWADFLFRVPQQAQRCIEVGTTRGLKRSHAPGKTELAHSGGEGGQPFELSCAPGQHIVGARVESSNRVNRLQLHCEAADTKFVGETKDSTRTLDKRCAEGDVVVGLWGSHTNTLHQLGIFCTSRAEVATGATEPDTDSIWLGGSTDGVQFARRCPFRMAATALYGQSGARIDQIRLVCETVDGRPRGALRRLTLLGTRTGGSQGGYCLGNGVLIGLFGNSGAEVDKLGGICRPTRAAALSGLPLVGSVEERHIIDAIGGEGGNRFSDQCPEGTVLVGLRARSGARLDQVAGICANPSQWESTSAVPLTITPVRGGNTGIPQNRQCQRGEYLVGLEVWAESNAHPTPTVQGVIPVCRRLRPPIEITPG